MCRAYPSVDCRSDVSLNPVKASVVLTYTQEPLPFTSALVLVACRNTLNLNQKLAKLLP